MEKNNEVVVGKINLTIMVDGENVFSTNSTAEAFFYAQMRSFNGLTHEDALKAKNLAIDMYLKDPGDTPIGNLSDYVGKHFERLLKMDSVWKMLYDFYDGYESEDYDVKNQYSKE
jgi:hypothetical protein